MRLNQHSTPSYYPSITDVDGKVTIGVSGGSNMHTINGYLRPVSPVTPLSSSGNLTIDGSVRDIYRKTAGNCTITFNNVAESQQIHVLMEANGSAYNITYSGLNVRWPDAGTSPVFTATSGRYDLLSFIKVGGNLYGTSILNLT